MISRGRCVSRRGDRHVRDKSQIFVNGADDGGETAGGGVSPAAQLAVQRLLLGALGVLAVRLTIRFWFNRQDAKCAKGAMI